MGFNQIVAVAIGTSYAAVGVFGLAKFSRQLVRPLDDAHRTGRLPFALMMGRALGVGGGFIAFGLTHAWIALVLGATCAVSDVAISRWTLRPRDVSR